MESINALNTASSMETTEETCRVLLIGKKNFTDAFESLITGEGDDQLFSKTDETSGKRIDYRIQSLPSGIKINKETKTIIRRANVILLVVDKLKNDHSMIRLRNLNIYAGLGVVGAQAIQRGKDFSKDLNFPQERVHQQTV